MSSNRLHVAKKFLPLNLLLSLFFYLVPFLLQLSLSHINNCIAETRPVYMRPECKERSSGARSLPRARVWGTGNCRSLSFGSSLDPLDSSWIWTPSPLRWAPIPHRSTAAPRPRPHHRNSLGIAWACGHRKSSTCFLRVRVYFICDADVKNL